MEVFVAKFDYEKEREDLLSFKEGDKFRIASKADKKWWAAYTVETGDYGYVPSSYMKRYVDDMEKELVHSLSESEAGAQKRQALQELKTKVKPEPASDGTGSHEVSEEESGEENEKTEEIIIKPLKTLSVVPNNDSEQIEPKKLYNPVMASRPHMQLHKELKFTHAKGGIQSILGKPELEKVWQRRRPDSSGKMGSIRSNEKESNKTFGSKMDNDLETQLSRRSKAVDNDGRIEEEKHKKPEFMNVALRKTQKAQQ